MSYSAFLPDARWIWPKISMYLMNSYAGFRYDFTQKTLPSAAPFLITADQAYKLHVNGTYVCRGPMRGQQENWSYDTVDLLPYLKEGHNWISIEGHNPGASTFYYHHKDSAGMICSASWDNGVRIVSNAKDWVVFRNTAYRHDTAQLSGQMGKMEELDLRYDDRSWITEAAEYQLPPEMPGINTMERAQGALPWVDLSPRPIPLLKEQFILPDSIHSSGWGTCAEVLPSAPGIVLNTAHHFLKYEKDSIHFDEQPLAFEADAQGIGFTVPAASKGTFRMVTLDLGRLNWLPGCPVLDFGENEAGTVLDIFYNQYRESDPLPFHPLPSEGSNVALASRIHLGGTPGRAELFQIMGTRFVTLIIRENPAPLTMRFAWRSAVYPVEETGKFTCSDELLNQIYEISVHTQKVCSMDAFVDTPWREQSQWWGDARIQARNMIYLNGDMGLFRSGIRSIASQTNPFGLPYANAPTRSCGPVLPDFALTWIITLRDLWLQTGETAQRKEWKSVIDKIFAYFESQRSENGLIQYDPRFWLFEDWSTLPKNNIPTFINLWYIYAEERYLELLKADGSTEEANALQKKIRQEKELAGTLLFDPEQQLFLPELNAEGILTGPASVHDQVLAILTGLHPEATDSMLEKVILPCLNGTLEAGAQPSAFWATYLFDCAFLCGKGKEALEYIRRMWAPMIPVGTAMENFPGAPISELSCSHAWSAHPVSHIPELIFGLEQLEPRWEKIRLKPAFLVEQAEFQIDLPQGKLSAKVSGSPENFSLEINVPQGVQAEIHLPGETVSASGETVIR